MHVSVFPTVPKFQLGQAVIHSYEADLMKDGVVPAKDFGIIVGIIYCDEESIYTGWSYQVYLWKSIYEHEDRREVEYYSDVSYSSFDESESVEITSLLNPDKLIKKINRRQMLKYNNYNKRNTSKVTAYDLVYDILVKDTYYSDLINNTYDLND